MTHDPVAFEIFRGVERRDSAGLLALSMPRDLAAGDVLLRPGDSNEYLYLVEAGRLRVALGGPDLAGGIPIAAGECVGEMSIIEGGSVSAFVVADEPTRLLAIHRDAFWQQAAHSPAVVQSLLRIMAERIRAQNASARDALEQKLRLEHLERELAQARDIQAAMLPSSDPALPGHRTLDVAALMEPAREVGGDFYDIVPLDEQRVAVAVGDVSGKGMPAALFMARSLALLRAKLAKAATTTLGRIVEEVNAELSKDNATCMFTTLLLAVIDAASGEMTYVNGGHLPPLRAGTGEGFERLDMPRGLLLGISEDAEFGERTVCLRPLDTLVFYTDGVTEAEDTSRDMFGEDGLRRLLARREVATATDTVDLIRRAVGEFAGDAPQTDDVTILVLRYVGA